VCWAVGGHVVEAGRAEQTELGFDLFGAFVAVSQGGVRVADGQFEAAAGVEERLASTQLVDTFVEGDEDGQGVDAELDVGVGRRSAHELAGHLPAADHHHRVLGRLLSAEHDRVHACRRCGEVPPASSRFHASMAWGRDGRTWWRQLSVVRVSTWLARSATFTRSSSWSATSETNECSRRVPHRVPQRECRSSCQAPVPG
jgi:hypothetical protein